MIAVSGIDAVRQQVRQAVQCLKGSLSSQRAVSLPAAGARGWWQPQLATGTVGIDAQEQIVAVVQVPGASLVRDTVWQRR
ncbi:hypothetical protein GCM10014715_14680 [Streptomyces spiralis]|uniref:Uncharacterized protein n=1 Tax=Streptomyces spiralis TaxID=66376 RepID=A0A918ZPN2_9ACTN|nr:hypothetical protein GCM10014715_14680 [Streptomyces spiralis]